MQLIVYVFCLALLAPVVTGEHTFKRNVCQFLLCEYNRYVYTMYFMFYFYFYSYFYLQNVL